MITTFDVVPHQNTLCSFDFHCQSLPLHHSSLCSNLIMPLIEVLPNSTSVSAPGWAYVPDTGYDPSKAPIQPSGARQRAARNLHVGDGPDLSARQQNAIAKHLAELDKDNYREVTIAIPKSKDGAGRGTLCRSPSPRRIISSLMTE